MLKKINNILVETYENYYMNNNESSKIENKKEFRSFQEFNNFCKLHQLIAKLIENTDEKENKYLIINLFIKDQLHSEPIKFEYYDINNQTYYQKYYKQFNAIKDFLTKYIITKTGQKKYPICILG